MSMKSDPAGFKLEGGLLSTVSISTKPSLSSLAAFRWLVGISILVFAGPLSLFAGDLSQRQGRPL